MCVKISIIKGDFICYGGVIIKNLNFDCITLDGVNKLIDCTKNRVTVLETVDSTNLYLKRNADTAQNGDVVIALSQTNGRGRFTRKFHSPQNTGIYMSFFLQPQLPAIQAVLITTAAAVAVCEACEQLGAEKCEIKWVNDVLINSKKVCGILTEGSVNSQNGMLDYAILGIGINVYEPEGGFDDEIKNIAGSVFKKVENGLSDRLVAEIINRFMKYFKDIENKPFLDSYRERSYITGKNINVIKLDSTKPAKAISIDDKFKLLVEYEDKTQEYISSGEVSVRTI